MREKKRARRKEKKRKQTRTRAQAKERNTKPQPTFAKTGLKVEANLTKTAAHIRKDKGNNTNLIKEKEP